MTLLDLEAPFPTAVIPAQAAMTLLDLETSPSNTVIPAKAGIHGRSSGLAVG
jgi:hypothetical protein